VPCQASVEDINSNYFTEIYVDQEAVFFISFDINVTGLHEHNGRT
jgi:hypothetical protein